MMFFQALKFLLTLIQSDSAKRATANAALAHSYLQTNDNAKLGTSDDDVSNTPKSKNVSKISGPQIVGLSHSNRNPNSNRDTLDDFQDAYQSPQNKKSPTPPNNNNNKGSFFPNIQSPAMTRQNSRKLSPGTRDSHSGAYNIDTNKNSKQNLAQKEHQFAYSNNAELVNNTRKLSASPNPKDLIQSKTSEQSIVQKLSPKHRDQNYIGNGLELNKNNFLMPPSTIMRYKNSISPTKRDHSNDLLRYDSKSPTKNDYSRGSENVKKLPLVKPKNHRTMSQDNISIKAILLKNIEKNFNLTKNLNSVISSRIRSKSNVGITEALSPSSRQITVQEDGENMFLY